MALIQPCRGAPPEPLGDGTQASFQPSLKNVESGSGRQVFGSGLPKSDSVIVSKSPSHDPGRRRCHAVGGVVRGPGTVIGAGVTSGAVALSTTSANTRGWRSGRR